MVRRVDRAAITSRRTECSVSNASWRMQDALLRSLPVRQACIHDTDLLRTCRKPRKQSAESAFLSIIAAFAIFSALAGLLALLLCRLPFP